MLQLKTPVTSPTIAATKVRRRQGRRCSIASALIASCSLLACLVGGPTILPQACAASAAAGGGTSSTPVSPSLPEILPAVRKLPDDDVTKDDNDERIEHVTPATKLPQDQENDNTRGGSNFVPAIETSHSAIEEEAWREQLPHQLQQRRGTLHRLLVPMPRAASGLNEEVDGNGVDDDIVEIYLLGTSHVSSDSCEDARLLVEAVCPDVLFIELCHQRLALLADDTPAGGDSSNQPEGVSANENTTPEKAKQQSKAEKQPRGMSWSAEMLTKIQQDYATKLGVDIGGEFREAYAAASRQQKTFEEEMNRRRFGLVNPAIASSVGPITVILGDRPVRLTLLRAWESLRLFGKAKLCLGILWSSFRPPSEKELREWMDKIMNDPTNDLLTDSIAELAKHFPQIGRTIIDERDEYMSCKLKQTVNLLSNVPSIGRRRRIVAVVGAGHCPGISKRLASNTDTSIPEERLKKLIETKKWKIDNPHVQSLVTDVTEVHFQ